MKTFLADNKRRIGYSVTFSLILSICLVLGFWLEKNGSVPYNSVFLYLSFVLVAAVLSVISFFLFGKENPINDNSESATAKVGSSFVTVSFFVILGVWLVCLLAVFPGYYSCDAPEQYEMYHESMVTAHHPVLHTYLVGFLVELSLTLFKTTAYGSAAYCIIQMIITDFAFCAVIKYGLKKKLPKLVLIILLAWFALAPTNILMVLSVTKDSLFAPFFLLFVLKTVDAVTDSSVFESKKDLFAWGASAFFSAHFRNNAIYVMIPFLLFLVFYFRNRKSTVLFVSVLLAIVVFQGPIVNLMTVKGVDGKEYLSTPVQQVLRVYFLHGEEIEQSDREFVEYLFSGGAEEYENKALLRYYAKISDYGKWGLNRNKFEESKTEAVDLWKKWALEYPEEYVDAFFMLNYGFWYPFSTLVLYANETEGYFICRAWEPVYEEYKIPRLGELLRHFEYSSLVCNKPVTMWLFAPATYFYIMLFVFLKCLYLRRREFIAFIPALLVWLTFLLGPVALVRYVGFIYYMVPLEICLIYAGHKTLTKVLPSVNFSGR